MTYEDYENAIVELLDEIADTKVSLLPYVGELNAPMSTASPTVYVMVNGSNFATDSVMSLMSMKETVNCEIYIKARTRRGNLGVFATFEAVSKKLLGHRFADSLSPVVLGQFGYVSGLQNNWSYALTFSFERMRVEVEKKIEVPLIKQIKIYETDL